MPDPFGGNTPMSVSGDPDEYMGDDGDDLPLEGSSQFAMDLFFFFL